MENVGVSLTTVRWSITLRSTPQSAEEYTKDQSTCSQTAVAHHESFMHAKSEISKYLTRPWDHQAPRFFWCPTDLSCTRIKTKAKTSFLYRRNRSTLRERQKWRQTQTSLRLSCYRLWLVMGYSGLPIWQKKYDGILSNSFIILKWFQ